MADIKDILGVSRMAGGDGAPAKESKKEAKMERPKGMSREAFALLSAGSHPIMPTQLVTKKAVVTKQPKPSAKGIPTYQLRPFKNTARTDGLELTHWVKCYKTATGVIKEPEEEYSFAKYNKKVVLFKYDDEEYESLIKADSGNWTRAETDYLFELLDRFDLRWPVITDRFEFAGTAPGASRTMEDLKERYYTVARRLLLTREGGEASIANATLIKHPYNKAHERDRKAALNALLRRTAQQAAEDNAILAEARQIEERRKTEAAASAKKAAAAAASAAAAAGPAAVAASAAAGSARTGSPGAAVRAGSAPGASAAPGPAAGVGAGAGAVSAGRQLSPAPAMLSGELKHPEEFSTEVQPGMPSLFDAQVRPFKPRPGVYARGAHAIAQANSMADVLGQRQWKLVEASLAELNWPAAIHGPMVNTRAVCGSWLALRSEVLSLFELRKRVANRMGGGGDLGSSMSGAGPGAAGAGVGGPKTKKLKK